LFAGTWFLLILFPFIGELFLFSECL
jgi:hypothetical protein